MYFCKHQEEKDKKSFQGKTGEMKILFDAETNNYQPQTYHSMYHEFAWTGKHPRFIHNRDEYRPLLCAN